MLEITGEVQGGVVVLPSDASLPEGTRVTIVVAESNDSKGDMPVKTPRPGEALMKYAGICDDMPADGSVNVDHYLYGHPKK